MLFKNLKKGSYTPRSLSTKVAYFHVVVSFIALVSCMLYAAINYDRLFDEDPRRAESSIITNRCLRAAYDKLWIILPFFVFIESCFLVKAVEKSRAKFIIIFVFIMLLLVVVGFMWVFDDYILLFFREWTVSSALTSVAGIVLVVFELIILRPLYYYYNELTGTPSYDDYDCPPNFSDSVQYIRFNDLDVAISIIDIQNESTGVSVETV